MNKVNYRIPQEVFEKEIRYKIMAKLLKIREIAGDIEYLFSELKMNDPIAIMGVRKKVRLEDFKKQIDALLEKKCLEQEGDLLRITKTGEQYASAQKGESFGFLADY